MEKYLLKNKKVYDDLAIEYRNRREKRSEFEENLDVLGDSVLKYLSKESKLDIVNVLEIGPGAGQMLEYFERKNCRTIGIELSTEMSKIAKSYSPRSIIINANVNDIEFLDNQMDIIYIGAVIHLFPYKDAVKLMVKVSRWLKEDGVIFINTTISKKNQEGYFSKRDYKNSEERYRAYWTESDFEDFVINSGFTLLTKLYTNEIDRDKKWVALICRKGEISEE